MYPFKVEFKYESCFSYDSLSAHGTISWCVCNCAWILLPLSMPPTSGTFKGRQFNPPEAQSIHWSIKRHLTTSNTTATVTKMYFPIRLWYTFQQRGSIQYSLPSNTSCMMTLSFDAVGTRGRPATHPAERHVARRAFACRTGATALRSRATNAALLTAPRLSRAAELAIGINTRLCCCSLLFLGGLVQFSTDLLVH